MSIKDKLGREELLARGMLSTLRCVFLIRRLIAEVLFVYLEMVCLCEALVTVLAAKWQLDRVGRIVVSQFVEIRVVFPTNATIQWIVLLVNLHVVLDMALLDERLVAHVTPIWSLVIVNSDVID